MNNKKSRISNSISFIVILIIATIIVLPFVLMFFTSFKSMAEIQSGSMKLLPEEWLFSNYIDAFAYGDWGRYFYNTALVTVVTVGVSLVLNSMAGFAFARLNFKGRDFLFIFILLGLMIPAQVIIVPVFMIMKFFPLAGGNDIFGQGGIGFIDSYAGLILPYIAHPYGIFLCRQFYVNFPKSLDEAAAIEGCNKWYLYLKIYLPLSRPVITTLAIFKTVSTWNEYLWPLVMTNSDEMKTIQLGLSVFQTDYGVEWNLLMAATTVVILPLLIMFIVLQKNFVTSHLSAGMKG